MRIFTSILSTSVSIVIFMQHALSVSLKRIAEDVTLTRAMNRSQLMVHACVKAGTLPATTSALSVL